MGTVSCGDDLEALEAFRWSHDGGRMSRRHLGVAVGFVGGTLAAVLGVGLSAAMWLGYVTDASVRLGVLRTLLLLAAFPLVVFGAHCLDLLDAELAKAPSRAARRARVETLRRRRARGGRPDRARAAAGAERSALR